MNECLLNFYYRCFRAISITTRIETASHDNSFMLVKLALELYPLQLGLKHKQGQKGIAISLGFRAISITTRIETSVNPFRLDIFRALELYPLQLGLKPPIRGRKCKSSPGFRAISITTRIETHLFRFYKAIPLLALELYPLQLGLKPFHNQSHSHQ